MSEGLLAGRVALVTGAARGIGASICVGLARSGAAVIVNTRPGGSPPEETMEAIRDAGGHGEAIAADVGEGRQAEALVQEGLRRLGRLDILVNNAGTSHDGLLLEMSEQAWDAVFATNVRGAFNCLHAAVPHMIEERRGAIVNVSSVVADVGNVGATNYAASKGALNSLTRSAALELARFGIRINAVAPGVVETKIMERALARRRELLAKRIPMGRFATTEEIANVVVFLASDRASYITGEIIRVAGGMGLAC
jgi:3-oxoacyl-[acyl-carrier protein] reductase